MPGQVQYTQFMFLPSPNQIGFALLIFDIFCLVQWEFQVGPSVGTSAGDELWVARYILEVIIIENFKI